MRMQGAVGCNAENTARARALPAIDADLPLKGKWAFVCRDKHGRVKWVESIERNLVTNVGESHALQVTLGPTAKTATWYIGLTDGTPTVAETDTMALAPGWTEVTAYDEATRPEWVDGAEANQSIDNSASRAVFTINAGATVGGAFLVSDNTRGGAVGILYAVGAFTGGDRPVVATDTLEVTATFTAGGA